jgi:hypothetical protein
VSVNGHGDDAITSAAVEAGSRPARLGPAERAAAAGVVVLVVLLGAIGAVNSFAAVAQAVEPSFGDLAWTVPVGIDVGIAVFTALDLLLSRLGMRMRVLRLVPWCLVAVTVYLNVAGEHDPVGAVAHGVLPLLWVVAVEAGNHAARTWAGLRSPGLGQRARRLDRVRWSRWLLAPTSTLRLWRRMVLWETASYPEALRRERDRVMARTELQDAWGALVWRWKAPRRARALYRLGELAPAGALADDRTADAQDATPYPERPLAQAPAGRPRRGQTGPARRNGAGRRTGNGRSTGRTDVADLRAAGRAVAAELAGEGRPLTRAALVERLRARGLSVSNARAGELLAELRTDDRNTATTTEGVA